MRILREKLEPLGFGSAFAEVPPGREPDIASPMGMKEVDEAVDAVAYAFTEQVRCGNVEVYRTTSN